MPSKSSASRPPYPAAEDCARGPPPRPGPRLTPLLPALLLIVAPGGTVALRDKVVSVALLVPGAGSASVPPPRAAAAAARLMGEAACGPSAAPEASGSPAMPCRLPPAEDADTLKSSSANSGVTPSPSTGSATAAARKRGPGGDRLVRGRGGDAELDLSDGEEEAPLNRDEDSLLTGTPPAPPGAGPPLALDRDEETVGERDLRDPPLRRFPSAICTAATEAGSASAELDTGAGAGEGAVTLPGAPECGGENVLLSSLPSSPAPDTSVICSAAAMDAFVRFLKPGLGDAGILTV